MEIYIFFPRRYLALILVGFGVFAMLHGTAILIINVRCFPQKNKDFLFYI